MSQVPAGPSFPSLAISIVLAYLIGGLPFGYWFVLLSSGKDVRMMGSGNIGATNVHRTAGRKAGIIVLLLDVLKGFVAVWLAAHLNGGDLSAVALAAVAVMVGHCYPVFLNFKGGKAVACFLGAFIYFAPFAVAVTAVAFVIVVAVSKFVSLGSLAGTVVFPLAVWILGPHVRSALWASVAASLLVIYRHKGNIARLRRGTEAPFSLKGGNDGKEGKA